MIVLDLKLGLLKPKSCTGTFVSPLPMKDHILLTISSIDLDITVDLNPSFPVLNF